MSCRGQNDLVEITSPRRLEELSLRNSNKCSDLHQPCYIKGGNVNNTNLIWIVL